MRQMWQLQEAKNKFSRVVEKAITHGPQIITRRGLEVVVVLSYDEYNRLRKPVSDIVEFFRSSPLVGVELDLERDRSLPRENLKL